MRADRLLSIVLLLQVNQRMTSRALAERLEVSERTIHRDMDALSHAGIPVVADRGSLGGWSLLEGYRTNLTGLSEAEIQSLFVTKPAKILADLKLDSAAEGAFLKLLASLPANYRASAERARQRIYVDVTGWAKREESISSLPLIQEAIRQERQVRITYERGTECEPVERSVSPLGLVAKGSIWYLVAKVDNSLRSYRVSRISKATMLDQPSTWPENFDLANYWEDSKQKFKTQLPKYTARFRVSPAAFPRLPYAGKFARVGKPESSDAQGWIEVAVGFDVEEMACEYALGFGSELEVLEPISLRARVIAAAHGVLNLYQNRQSRVQSNNG